MLRLLALLAALVAPSVLLAADPLKYGESINTAAALKALQAATIQATKESAQPNGPTDGDRISVAIVDSSGRLVLFQRGDYANYASIDLSIRKAMTAIEFQASSAAIGTAVGLPGGVRFLKLDSLPLDGGLLIVKGNAIIGAIGVAGASSDKATNAIAKAGADAAIK